MSDSAKDKYPMSDSLTQTAQAKEVLLYRIRRSCAIPQDVDDLIAAVLADHDAQTRQAFEAGWESGRGRFAESLSTADVSKAYAAYLATVPAQKGTP